MKKSFIIALITYVFSMGISMNARAFMVTETWQSTITQVDHAAFAVGDTFTWAVTYDNESLRVHTYIDGAKGVAEFGGGDDTIFDTQCAGTEAHRTG